MDVFPDFGGVGGAGDLKAVIGALLTFVLIIAVLNNGQMVEISTPEDFIKSKNAFVRSFLDSQYITKKGEWEDHGVV